MLYRNSACAFNSLTILILTIQSGNTNAQPDCSVLANEQDIFICEKYGADKDWLNSVQKIDPDTPLNTELLSHPNRLYIFEGKSDNTAPAKYELPAFYSIPSNAAFVGNYGEISAPVLLISKQNKGVPLRVDGSGNYLLANISVTAQSSGQVTYVFSGEGADYLEVSSVTFKSEGDYVQDDTSHQSAYTLFLAVSPSEVFIHDSTFIMPNVPVAKAQSNLSAVIFIGAGDEGSDELIKVKYSDNTIISDNSNNKYAGNLVFRALVTAGNVEIDDNSSCNSVTTHKENDLLSPDSNLLAAEDISPTKSGAFGFTNGYAWGWIANNNSEVTVSYNTWDYWSKQNINTQCSQMPASGSDSENHANLAVKIIVPVVTVGAFAVMSVVGLIAGRKYLRKIRINGWQKFLPATSATSSGVLLGSNDFESENVLNDQL